jgi:hypothetical protein
MEFTPFPKIPRLSREIVVTEKIDGTNASVFIEEVDPLQTQLGMAVATFVPHDGRLYRMLLGSRTRWITPNDDNFGFARWAVEHSQELVKLGPGHHFGEWWGSGIQRGYDLPKGEKRFSLFNAHRWDSDDRPSCCSVVPVLYRGDFDTKAIENCLWMLETQGSLAAPGFKNPEGVIVYHRASNQLFKKTIHKDNEPKSKEAA